MRIRQWLGVAGVAAVLIVAATGSAQAAPVTGTYTLGGATACAAGPALPCTMTSTDSTFSVLRLVFDTPVLFSNLTDFSYSYDMVLGGIAGGAPRLVLVTSAGDGITVHWGPAGSYVNPALGPGSTGNLLALTDVGRYDLSDIGGSAYTDRAAALTLAGSLSIVRASLVLDSFAGNDRNIVITGIAGSSAAVPEPASILLLGSALLGLAYRRVSGRR